MRLNEASTSLHTQPSGIRELFIHFLRQQKSQSWLGRHRPREGGGGGRGEPTFFLVKLCYFCLVSECAENHPQVRSGSLSETPSSLR